VKPDPTALVIDSDRAARRLLRTLLEPQGYRVLEAETGQAGLRDTVDRKPDIIILDIALPDMDGRDVLCTLRQWNLTPILVLSHAAEDPIKVATLDAGANDYLTKPFSGPELLARLRVLQRPLPAEPDCPLLIDEGLKINLATHETHLDGQLVRLSPKEEALFYVLARYAGKIVTCTHLTRSIWGLHSEDKLNDLRVLMAHLRKKLGRYGGETLIRTAGALGYSLSIVAATDHEVGSPNPEVTGAKRRLGIDKFLTLRVVFLITR
jgi:two-component system KDP operon response regulator KdpE